MGLSGLVMVKDTRIFQDLLTIMHKVSDNWTRDRGCALHGVNGCSFSCSFRNQNPVPVLYQLAFVERNQNLDLWKKYCLLRSSIRKECVQNRLFQTLVPDGSKQPFANL